MTAKKLGDDPDVLDFIDERNARTARKQAIIELSEAALRYMDEMRDAKAHPHNQILALRRRFRTTIDHYRKLRE